MNPYRCMNPECAPNIAANKMHDFWSTEPVCPKCGADQRKEDDHGIIVTLTVIHLDPPHPKYAHMGRGAGYRACDQKFRGMRTGDPRAVNCPACLKSEEIKKVIEEFECMAEMPPEDAFEAFRRVAPVKAKEYEAQVITGE